MRISDWSSDVCSSDLTMRIAQALYEDGAITYMRTDGVQMDGSAISAARKAIATRYDGGYVPDKSRQYQAKAKNAQEAHERSDEHTSELQSLMLTSYAVFCLQKKILIHYTCSINTHKQK